MKEQNVILSKTFEFGLRIIKLHLYLKKKNVDRVLSIQLLRSGTSIGANVEEAIGASSKKRIYSKTQDGLSGIQRKKYWLRLLAESKLLELKIAASLLLDLDEILKILTSIINTSKLKPNY